MMRTFKGFVFALALSAGCASSLGGASAQVPVIDAATLTPGDDHRWEYRSNHAVESTNSDRDQRDPGGGHRREDNGNAGFRGDRRGIFHDLGAEPGLAPGREP